MNLKMIARTRNWSERATHFNHDLLEVWEPFQGLDLDLVELFNPVHCIYFIIFTSHCKSKTISAKPTRATHAVHKVCEVRLVESAFFDKRNIVVQYKIDFRHIDASREDVRRDKAVELLLAEPVNNLVSFCCLNSTNQNM